MAWRLKQVTNDVLTRHTGQTYDRVMADTERDNYMTAAQAAEYGLIDEVIECVSDAEPEESEAE